jgi:hypothetical protein
MTNSIALRCDGCGQSATPEHITRRLQRLAWTTQYRPVHIGTLLLGSASPREEKDFLYSPQEAFEGEAGQLLRALDLSFTGKAAEAVQVEFQRGGFFLTHILECPYEHEVGGVPELSALLAQRLTAVATRIRRSLKPKRIVLISRELEPILEKIAELQLGCPVVMDDGKPFDVDGPERERAGSRLRAALAVPVPG